MGRVLLIIGAVVGGLVFAFGTLGLILAFAQPDAQQSDEVVGSIFFMVVGAIVAAPCIYFARGAPVPGAELRQSYLAWFGWCQQVLGGDAISLHARVMVTVTDRRVIAVGQSLLGGLANKVAVIEPRSTVSVKFPKGIFGRTMFSLKGQEGGSVEIIVPRPWRREAEMALELLAPSTGQLGSAGIIR
jgi:hypothetical protein